MAAPATRSDHGPRTGTRTASLSLLGGFRLVDGDGQVVDLAPGGQRLVALLAVRGPLSRAAAARLLWPDVDDDRAHARLRTTLWRLRGPDLDPGAPRLSVPDGTVVDVWSRTAVAERLVRQRTVEPDDLEALAAARGELLPGWYDDWVQLERERLRALHQQALETLACIECDRGRYAIAVDAALAAVRLEPLRESVHHVLIRAHLGEHNLVEAARHYRMLTRLLDEELGVAPSRALTALVAAHGLAG